MMQVSEVLRLVFINIVENKFKMMLTSLGIIVGRRLSCCSSP
jgi:putative ABC transport system permease protein